MSMNLSTKNGNAVLAIVLSIIALLLCVLILLLWIFEVIPHSTISPDTFIGACITLLSVIVTIGIGWQIFNVVEMKNTMKELKEKQYVVDNLQKELKNEIQKVKDDAEDMECIMYYLQAMTISMQAMIIRKYDSAFYNFLLSLSYYIRISEQDAWIITDVIQHMKSSLKVMKKEVYVTHSMMLRINDFDKLIKESKSYRWFKNDYDEVMTNYLSRLKEN